MDIYADKPWALSPALATMNYLSVGRSSGDAVKREEVGVEEDSEALEDLGDGGESRANARINR